MRHAPFLLALALGCAGPGPADSGFPDPESPCTQVTLGRSGEDRDPDLSPDGTQLVFSSTSHGGRFQLLVKTIGQSAVTRIGPLAGNQRFPRFNPADPRMLAYCSDESGSWRIHVLPDWSGRPDQRLTISDPERSSLHPSWSPDGRRLAFCSTDDPAGGDWILEVADLAERRLTRLEEIDGLLPSWSPSGDRLAFQRMKRRDGWLSGLWTLDLGPAGPRNVTCVFDDDDWAAINPAWSPDGRRLVFATVGKSRARAGLLDRADDLWTVDAGGGSPTRLTTSAAGDWLPAWSSDGRVYFVSDRNGASRIWSVRPEGP